MQQQKENILFDLLKSLIVSFGLPLLQKVLDKHKEQTPVVGDILPHLEAMTAHELNTVISVANGLAVTKTASSGDPLPPDPTHPKPPAP